MESMFDFAVACIILIVLLGSFFYLLLKAIKEFLYVKNLIKNGVLVDAVVARVEEELVRIKGGTCHLDTKNKAMLCRYVILLKSLKKSDTQKRFSCRFGYICLQFCFFWWVHLLRYTSEYCKIYDDKMLLQHQHENGDGFMRPSPFYIVF